MSHNQNNDYKNIDSAKPVKDVGKKLAQVGGQKAKQLVRKGVEKAAKKVASVALKKLVGGLLIKTAPIWGGAVALILIVLASISIFVPDISADRVKSYGQVSSEIGLSSKLLLAFDTALYENDNLDGRNPNDNAFYFMRIIYERYSPSEIKCLQYDLTDNSKCIKEEEIPERIIEHKEVQGKEAIKSFFISKGQSTENIKKALQGIRNLSNVRLTIVTLPLEVAMDQANFTNEQKEYFEEIISSGLMDEEYPDIGFSYGTGAVCAPNKEIDNAALDRSFANAGVLTKYKNNFITIANKNKIDPIIMIAIAFQETGYGTSNLVQNKNNPGGLMNPDGSGPFVFTTLNDGLESMGRTLHNRIIKDGKTTVDLLGSVYAPVGASNDPAGLNSHWVPNVTEIIQNLGGLTMNCEADDLPNMDGVTSETSRLISMAGFQWINNSEYIFGGGRSQTDIQNGWFDCSSFVHWAYLQGGINLGNLSSVSTETLNKIGNQVAVSDLRIGDLLFWDTYKKDGHVGIYIGNGKFIGAQSSTGVAIVNLNNVYWQSKFSGHVRRILP